MSKYKPKYIKRAYSHDTLRAFTWNKDAATVYPDFSFQAVLNMVNNDPVTRGAIQHYVDKCMEGVSSIVKRDTLKYDAKEELRLEEKFMFRNILRKVFHLGKLFNNVFIEIVRDTEGKTKSLNVLDSQSVQPITEPNGDPIKYKSQIPNATTGKYPEWDKKDITWIKFGDISKGYAPLDLRALYENLLAKEFVTRYVAWLWKTGQYRIMYNPKGGSDKDVVDFITFAKRNDENYKVPFIFKGELETKVLRDIKETESIERLLKYYDSQSLILFRIPPNDAGIPDASGRSNADAQTNNLSTHITSQKKIVEDGINYDLFPKINKANNLLKFGPNDRFSEKSIFENIQIMKSINMTDDVVKEYLSDKGLFYAAKLFVDPVEQAKKMQAVMQPEEPAVGMNKKENPKDKDKFASRQRKTADGSGNKQQATPTTRADQLGEN